MASPTHQMVARLSETLAPVSLVPVGALVCAAGSVVDVAYHEYRQALGRLIEHVRSYDEGIHGAIQSDPREEYEQRWRAYQTAAASLAVEQNPEDADYAGELAVRNAEISKRRDLILVFTETFDRDAGYSPDLWFEQLEQLIDASQKEWDEMVDFRHSSPDEE